MSAEKPDISSLLSHVNTLEQERATLKQEREKLESILQSKSEQLNKFQESKRTEMKAKLDTMISDWLKDIDVGDETVKKEFMTGMDRLVNETKEDSGVWQVMCCASAAHKQRVTEIQRLKDEFNDIKTKAEAGTFKSEDARIVGKRKDPETASRDIWTEFEGYMKSNGVSDYIPHTNPQ